MVSGIMGAAECGKEDKESWSCFLRCLKGRGFEGVKVIISGMIIGLLESVGVSF